MWFFNAVVVVHDADFPPRDTDMLQCLQIADQLR